GITSTFAIAAAINLIVGLTAVVLSSRALAPGGSAAAETDATAERHSTFTTRQLTTVLAVFTLSGVISLALEVVWFRVLTLFLRPTVYGFAVMLATILTGIALGSYIVTPLLDRRRRWVAVLAALELATAVAIVLSFTPLSRINDVWR